jgi:hypothetical protein
MVPQWHKGKHINFNEISAVLHTQHTCTIKSRAWRIKLHCHNKAVMAAVRKGRIKGKAISLLWQIAMHRALHDLELH